MKLNYIELTNFRSHKYSFLDCSNFSSACVVGKNGAGKSSFAYGFCHNLWGEVEGLVLSNLIMTDAVKMETASGFTHDDGNNYRIERGVKVTGKKKKTYTSYLSLLQEDEAGTVEDARGIRYNDISGNSISDTTKQISLLLGNLTMKTAIHSNFDLQGESSRFMNARPGERRKLFEKILNLEEYEDLEKAARAKVKTAKTILKGLDIDDDKEALLQLQATDGEKQLVVLKKDAGKCQEVIDISTKTKHSLEAIITKGTSDLEESRKPLFESLGQLTEDEADITKRLANCNNLIAEKENITKKYSELQEKQTELKGSQEARQLYTVAKGERRVVAGEQTFAKSNVVQIKESIAKEENDIYFEKDNLVKKYSFETSEALFEQILEKVTNTKLQQETAQQKIIEQKDLLVNLNKEQNILSGEIASLETSERNYNKQIKKIKEAGALCPIFNTSCEKLSDEYKETELERLSDLLAVSQVEKNKKNNQKDSNKKTIVDINKELERLVSTEKNISQAIVTAKRDADGYEKLADKVEKKVIELKVKLQKEETLLKTYEDKLIGLDSAIIATGFNPDKYDTLKNTVETLEKEQWQEKKEQLALAEAVINDLEKQIQLLQEQKKTVAGKIGIIAEQIDKQKLVILEKQQELLLLNETIKQDKEKQKEINAELSATSKHLGVTQTLLNQIREQKNKSLKFQKEIADYSILEQTYKKVRALIVENSVPKFQELCNNILDYLEINIRIRVETLEEVKDNKTKELKLNPTFKIIVVDGNKGTERLYGTWSGGEKQRINLATRQALSTILLNRAGTRMDLIIIDESDSALDDIGKAALVKLIQANVEGRFGRPTKVMCMTHTEDLKNSFPTWILIKMNKGISSIAKIQ